MLVEHFAVGFVGRRATPQVSLGTLTLASTLPCEDACRFRCAIISNSIADEPFNALFAREPVEQPYGTDVGLGERSTSRLSRRAV